MAWKELQRRHETEQERGEEHAAGPRAPADDDDGERDEPRPADMPSTNVLA